jgi:hypothetical protein
LPGEWFNRKAARANVAAMRHDLRGKWLTGALWLAAPLLLVGCTKSASDAASLRQSHDDADKAQATVASSAALQAAGDADMVAAVSNVSSDTPISLKFRLASRPEVDKPVIIEIALVPDAAEQIQHIHLSFQPGEGLEIQGEQKLDIEARAAAGAMRHDLTVVPRHTGVLQLHATAVVDTNSASLARSYGIPVITFDAPRSAPPSHSVPD